MIDYKNLSNEREPGPSVVLIAAVCLAALVSTTFYTSDAVADQQLFEGIAVIVDGDTLELAGQPIRLHGIDAPEAGQRCERASGREYPCGREAINHLTELVANRTLQCSGDTFDDFDRLIAVCSADNQDISSLMASAGWAWAFVRFSEDYLSEEAEARQSALGVWQGTSQPAWEYRAERWQVAVQEAPEGCPIKGNISQNGQIYHAPWSPWYSRTSINEARGERWFCSEREALDAGWRAPFWR